MLLSKYNFGVIVLIRKYELTQKREEEFMNIIRDKENQLKKKDEEL
jgi:hypothetical protein